MSAEAEAPAEQRKKRPAAKQTGTAIIHSLWDERDEDYAPVDHATYSGNIWNLFEVSYIAYGKENNFTYDARGNRISEIETYTGSNGRVTDYEYYENSDLIKKAGNWYFNYDKNGNLTARGTEAQDSGNELFSAWTFSETDGELWTYEYDLQNRMTKANYSGKGSANLKERGSYVYDYRGLLIKKTYQNYNPSDLVEVVNDEASKPVTEFYEYTADGKVIYNERSEDNNTKKTTYIWANTTLWCEVNEGVLYYHHTDHLGTTEVVTDQNGEVVWEAGYEAFGSVLSERGDSAFTPSYTGKFFDKASGLYYFNARWYDSELGKFTSSDPIRDGLNWWNYCNGNPLKYTDPDGEKVRKLTDIQWTIVKTNLGNLTTNLDSIIKDLDNCNNDIAKLNPDIVKAAKKYLSSQFGSLPLDISVLKEHLQQQKDHIESLDRNDFKYDDETSAFAYTFPLFDDIVLGDSFFDANDSGGFDTKEGTLLHESTHYKWILGTTDVTYIKNEMENLPDDGRKNYKSNNANNWEYFYEALVE